MNTPKIIVIIPTRERCDVLEKSLHTVTSQTYENLEIVVSDNFSVDDTRGVVERAGDSRIRYLNTGARLSMSRNWEFALSHVQDGWVTFMGDDDGLPPGAIETVANIVRATGSKAIRSRFCGYEWPAVTGKGHGHLITPMGSGLHVRDAAAWLSKVMRGHAKYTELPMIYNGGFIHTSILDNIRNVTGSYFRSSSPDVYSAIAISSIVKEYIFSDEPLAISGTSRHSTGNSFYSTSKRRDPTPGAKFATEENLPFHEDMPLCDDGGYPLSLHALVYESYLQSMSLRPAAGQVDHVRQLEIIMGTGGVHRASVHEWGKRFADQHGLDYQKAVRGARLRGYFLRPYSLALKVLRAANSISVGSPNTPIRDIYEASIAASIVRSSPSRTGTMYGLLKQQLVGKG